MPRGRNPGMRCGRPPTAHQSSPSSTSRKPTDVVALRALPSSAAMKSAVPPAARISASALAASLRRPETRTCAPCWASVSAQARPIPAGGAGDQGGAPCHCNGTRFLPVAGPFRSGRNENMFHTTWVVRQTGCLGMWSATVRYFRGNRTHAVRTFGDYCVWPLARLRGGLVWDHWEGAEAVSVRVRLRTPVRADAALTAAAVAVARPPPARPPPAERQVASCSTVATIDS